MRTRIALLSLLILLLASACDDEAPSEPASDATHIETGDLGVDFALGDLSADDGSSTTEYEPVDPILAESLQVLLNEHVLFSGEANASLTLLQEGTKWTGVAGVQDIRTGTEMELGAAFRVGSSTKPYVATVVLQLAEEGLLGLDDPLGDYVSDYPAWSDVTVRQLLGMRSGIPDYLLDQNLWLGVVMDPDRELSPDELLGYVSGLPMSFEPDQRCEYSNTNYILLGLIIEEVTGRPVETEIAERIVEPLGLAHTYLDVEGAVDDRLAHGYMDPRAAFLALGVPLDLIDMIPAALFADDYQLDCAQLFHPSVAWSAGALVTTTDDTATFMRSLLNEELIGRGMLDEMMEFPPCTILGDPADYGLGLTAHDTPFGDGFGHGGLIYGYSANTTYIPDADLGFSSMHGAYPAQQFGLITELYRLLLQPPEEPLEACELPEGFFDDTTEPRLEVRIRARLNRENDPEPWPAVANIVAYVDGDRFPLFGTWTSVKIEPDDRGARVAVESYGPPRDAEHGLSQGLISITPSIFDAARDDGHVNLSNVSRWSALMGMVDIKLDPATGQPNELCIAAVPDYDTLSKFYVCHHDDFAIEEGGELKFFAAIGLETDPDEIWNYLLPLNAPRCNCRGDDGEWAPCDEE